MRNRYLNIFTFIFAFTTLLTISSCEKYLDEPPSKSSSIQITSTQNLDALLENYTTMGQETNSIVRMWATDDFGFTTQAVAGAPSFYGQVTPIFYATWDRQYMDNSTNADWSFQWGRIFTANLVLNSLSKVSGSEQDKARLRAEAHFIRAFSYWVLANTYCLPFTNTNRNELGLPLKLNTSFEEGVARAPLYQVYEQIESDLAEALKTTEPLFSGTIQRCWRANVPAVNAFAARYYLHRGDYAQAEHYATLSLNAYSALVDYNTEMKYSVTFPNFPGTYNTVDLAWKEFTSYRVARHGGLVVPSENLSSLYDQTNDLRYVYHFVEGGPAILGAPALPVSYAFFGLVDIPSGTTVGETLVTKAEALARLDRVAEAMTVVNTLRAKRMKPGAWVNLAATTKAEAVTKILEERRRELPFNMRWFDLRRLNHNDDPNDDKTVTRSFYPYTITGTQPTMPLVTYTLAPGSRKYAVMIPRNELIASQGQIVQNTY